MFILCRLMLFDGTVIKRFLIFKMTSQTMQS